MAPYIPPAIYHDRPAKIAYVAQAREDAVTRATRPKYQKPFVISDRKYPGLPIRSIEPPDHEDWDRYPKYSISTHGAHVYMEASGTDGVILRTESEYKERWSDYPYQTILAKPPHVLSESEIAELMGTEEFPGPFKGAQNIQAHTEILNKKSVLVREYLKEPGIKTYEIAFNINPDSYKYYVPATLTYEAPVALYDRYLDAIKSSARTIVWHDKVKIKERTYRHIEPIKWGVIRQGKDSFWSVKYMQLPKFAEWQRMEGLDIHPGYSFNVEDTTDSSTRFDFSSSGAPYVHNYMKEILALPPHHLTRQEMDNLGYPETNFIPYTDKLNGRTVLFDEREFDDEFRFEVTFLRNDDESCQIPDSIEFEAKPEIYRKYIEQVKAAFKTIKWFTKADPRDLDKNNP